MSNENPNPDELDDQLEGDDITPEPDKGSESGFAAYDETLKRFVGKVQSKKPTAAELKKLGPASHKIVARKV